MSKMNGYYLSEIEKIPLLSQEEEKALANKAFSGDKSAQKKLVEHNLRFVVKIANQYQWYMDVQDLISAGNVGLMHAAEKFDPSTGNRFTTYSVWWIKAYIQKAIRETSTGIRFPATQFKEMKKSKWNIASLDKTITGTNEEETTIASFLKDERIKDVEEEFWENEALSKLHDLVETLNQKEKAVIVKRYGLDGEKPMSLSEIGTLMGYSKERIRQIEKRALLNLKEKIDNSKDYAELAA